MKPVNPDGKPFPGYFTKQLLPKLKSNVFVVSFVAVAVVAGAVAATAAVASGPQFNDQILAAEASVPVIQEISPSGAASGSEVTVTGSGFGVGGTQQDYVSFDGVPAEIASWADAEIVCAIPAGLEGEVGVIVTTAGAASESFAYTVSEESPEPEPAPEPTTGPFIDNVSPPSAWIGAEVTITGRGFGESGTVTIGGVAADIVSWSDTQIVCILPDGIAQRVDVVVSPAAGGSATGAITVRGDGKDAPDRGNSDPSSGNSQDGWPQTPPDNEPKQPPDNSNAGGNGNGQNK